MCLVLEAVQAIKLCTNLLKGANYRFLTNIFAEAMGDEKIVRKGRKPVFLSEKMLHPDATSVVVYKVYRELSAFSKYFQTK